MGQREDLGRICEWHGHRRTEIQPWMQVPVVRLSRPQLWYTPAKFPNGSGTMRASHGTGLRNPHFSNGKQAANQGRKVEAFTKHIFFSLSETANCLPVSSLHWWTIKHAADQELFSGTRTLVSYKYYSGRERNRYCLLMLPLNGATQMVINAS